MKKLWLLGVLALSPLAVRADSRIDNVAERVENQIERDYILRPFNFDTDTVGRRIILQGRVNTNAQRRRALSIARRYSGGFTIVNNIRLKRR